MVKFRIFALAALLVGVQGFQNQPINDYMELADFDFSEKFSNEDDKKVAADIKMFRNLNAESDDTLGDYQFEDNRFEEDETDDADDEIVKDDGNNKGEQSAEIDPELLVLDDLAKEVEDLNKIKEALDDSKSADENESENNDDALKEEPLDPIEKFDIDTDDIIKSDSSEIVEEKENADSEEDPFESLEEMEFFDLFKHVKSEYVDEAEAKALENVIDEEKENDKKIDSDKSDSELAVDDDDMKSVQEAIDDVKKSFDRLLENIHGEEQNNVKAPSALTSAEVEDDYNFPFEDYYDSSDNQTAPLEPSPDDAINANEESIQPLKIEYIHDALNASDDVKNPDAEMINSTASSTPAKEENIEQIDNQDSNEKFNPTTVVDEVPTTSESLSESEYEKLMTEFESQHRDEFNMSRSDFDRHVAPIHITITGQPTIVTSPNYPSNYPTNNIVDWIFDGDGEGIELNITDFAVNGHLGDYLLVKPGGVDASGTEGLVFSFTLNTERRYRFMDVHRMFVRFEARPGMAFTRGFSFSVKMLRPIQFEPVPTPDAEAVLRPAHSVITLNLGGTTLDNFAKTSVEEEFKQIVADMATMYINTNNIDPGLNTTSEVIQILSRALCFHNWPRFENCVEIKFGIPLEYEDHDQDPRLTVEDLSLMWATYFNQDPFAARLRRLGVTEYQVPNDSGIMTIWLVIASGVAIAAAMLAFALWRFSCFEGYTRMPPISDSDSIQEKRNLDLYPTPHQTLPPLYLESEYKWADAKYDDSTRVDMGGYANKNYLRDDLYDLESDDDVTARSSNKNITPRDIYV